MTDRCPTCNIPLAVAEDEPPWCSHCEWNLDTLAPIEGATWFWRSIRTRDHRAGFRSDRLLASGAARGRPWVYALLVALSVALVAVPVTAFLAGLWLLIAGPVALGLLLLLVAYAVRPRLGRVKKVLKGHYRVDADRAPALYGLIDRVATAVDAPRPDIVAIQPAWWNAGTTVAGLRQRRILMLGIPLLASLDRGEFVALLGHELGHFANRDSRRFLLTLPARVTFGHIARALRPSRVSGAERDLLGLQLIVFELWRLISGLLSWLSFAVHAAIQAAGSREDRHAEQRADLLAVKAAGRASTLGLFDAMAAFPLFHGAISGVARKGYAMAEWRARIAQNRARNDEGRTAVLRQLTIRTEASLFASHPSTGRRHQYVSTLPNSYATVTVTDTEWTTIVREVAPYAETLRNDLAEQYEM
ncbi:Zn-dependent protease with chaperone function [Asanoa hainanensis]|uniref:Zn-dependent protease with chaperone function n=1 Tax=Asanoa hainanensis TaxID=560556 RepID=A0A239PC49_9ACTN|nr:M48 family metallopeptidase [Asanoa hainanensis]SNT64148.1 Zn-dependent protease with chaperone function [Asanoa hainanensis]